MLSFQEKEVFSAAPCTPEHFVRVKINAQEID